MTSKEQFYSKLDGSAPRKAEEPTDIAQPHPKQKEAMALYDNLMRRRNMGISVDIRSVASDLKAVQAEATFPEELFVEHFLPFFAGEVQTTPEINTTVWIDKVAGNPYAPVKIITADGRTLFTIPPMFEMSVIEQTRPGSQAMTHIERQYSRIKEFDAEGSQIFISRKLMGMHIREEPSQQTYDNVRVWNAIFEHYGKSDKIIELVKLKDDPKKVNHTPVIDSGSKDLGEYELDTD